MLVVHANWSDGCLHLWGESLAAAGRGGATVAPAHAFAAPAPDVRRAIEMVVGSLNGAKEKHLDLLLPHVAESSAAHTMRHAPLASSRLAGLLGQSSSDEETLTLELIRVPTIALTAKTALPLLLQLREIEGIHNDHFVTAHAMHWWLALAQFALDCVIDQRVIPTVLQRRDGTYSAQWRPWLNDADANTQLADLLASMPAAARSIDGSSDHPWPIVDSFLSAMVDAIIRTALVEDDFEDSIADFDPATDPHAAWLSGLLGKSDAIKIGRRATFDVLRDTRGWLGVLDEARSTTGLRLHFEVREPDLDPNEDGTDANWRVCFGLVDPEAPESVIDAQSLFERAGGRRGSAQSARTEELSEMLLKELARASRIWPELEEALQEESPSGLDLDTRQIYQFMRDLRPILLEAGFFVEVPEWWGESASRINANLLIDSPEHPPTMLDAGSQAMGSQGAGLGLGLQSLVGYRWQVALGTQIVSIEMLEKLSQRGAPLARVGGRWVDLRPEDIDSALKFLRSHPGGQMSLVEALRMAHGIDGPPEALPVSGVQATGWVRQLLSGNDAAESFQMAEPPEAFRGTLRPYQLSGLSWLAFLDRLGLGACLADDMGLGKTIQLIALLQHERATNGGIPPGPSLLVTPMSVLGNWKRELTRFAPELTVHIHHGLDRPAGERFCEMAQSHDVVLTTYAIVVRDQETMQNVPWRRVVLDEAQYIKNPPTKQTAAIRSLKTRSRVALTGTPVENRLAELWSIIEFCCPGYLGTNQDFRRRFAAPIERNRDRDAAERLRALVRPFILRRLKTDSTVISDLPPLVESRQHITLTAEQMRLYDQVVAEMLGKVDATEGIRRRGLVLSALVKLKQICNHPAHFLGEASGEIGHQPRSVAKDAPAPTIEVDTDEDVDSGALVTLPPSALAPGRSGKTQRLIEMLEEVVAAGDCALIFTQYRQMGHLLVGMIRQALDVEPLFLHGGTPQAKRDALVERFQKSDGTTPIFVLSLKAGGVGLNLTAANHVFHFDRWWNPAVENQATDRAFRIGQTRTVNVHKYICTGSLEERIDQMIEAKTELATNIIGAGDAWLTELSTGQLRELLTLRHSGLEGGE
ncbi:MAG: DEAD/DEAH box helicase [Phycisphaerales bacterium]|nr:DEAD/DEAH box helicase [Phycisphaerales bacterium]